MAFTTAQREKFFELVKKYANASRYDEKAKDLSDRIAKMAKTPDGLNELAQLITENLEDEMKAYDLRPLIFETRQRNLNETVEYKRKGKFRAYRITRGGYVPKSEIFQDVVTATPEEFAVRPACHLDQLETGRISSVDELRTGAKEALLTEYARYFYETLNASVTGEGENDKNYAEVTGEVDKSTLDKMIHWAAGMGGGVSVVGTHQSLAPILDFFNAEQNKATIENTGNMGMYRGANLVKLEEFFDADELEVIDHNTLFIVTRKAGYVDDFGAGRTREVVDAEHDHFSIIIRKQMGLTVLYPERVGMIKIV